MKRKSEQNQGESTTPPDDAAAAAATPPAGGPGTEAAKPRPPEEELGALRALVQQLRNQSLELTADLDNQAKRFARERQVVREEIVMRLAREMIEVLDNLDAAVSFMTDAERTTNLGHGVVATRQVLLEKLRSFGVEPIESIGRPFDPAWHESLFESETAERPPGTILSELTRGYRLGNKVVRAAKVEIAKAPAAAKSAAPEGEGGARRGDDAAAGDD